MLLTMNASDILIPLHLYIVFAIKQSMISILLQDCAAISVWVGMCIPHKPAIKVYVGHWKIHIDIVANTKRDF